MNPMNVSIIGGGTIGSSMAIPIRKAGFRVRVTRRNTSSLRELEEYGIEVSTDNATSAGWAEIVIFALKPVDLIPQISKIREHLQGKIVISMAAAVPMSAISRSVGSAYVVRAMTNIASRVGSGFTPYSLISEDAEKIKLTEKVLGALGRAERVEERYMDALTALSGSGPAYILTIIEAMMYGGLKVGLPRDLALRASYQTVMGAAKLLAESGEHPSALKEKVITPGGTTIDGIFELEEGRVRTAIMKAIEASTQKAIKISEAMFMQ